MAYRTITALPVLALVSFCLAFSACDDDALTPDSGAITLQHDQGIDFASGRLQDPGNFANSDLYATINGDSGMKLVTGGNSPTNNRAISWFRTGGGIAATFEDLTEVPSDPAPDAFDALIHARSGNGFLLRAGNGDLVRGWLSQADAGSVSLQWARVAIVK